MIKVCDNFMKFGFCGDNMIGLIDATHILIHLEHEDVYYQFSSNLLNILTNVQCQLSNEHPVLARSIRPLLFPFGFHFLCCLFTFGQRAVCLPQPKQLEFLFAMMKRYQIYDGLRKLEYALRQIWTIRSSIESGLRGRIEMDIAKSSYVMIYLITIINVDILITLMNIV